MKKTGIMTCALVAFAILSGCLDSRPKIIGQGNKFDFGDFGNSNANLFRFNFALKGDAVAVCGTTFFLQGAANSKSALIGTCNLAGSGCVCKFLDENGFSAGPDASGTDVTFDERGNYFRCIYRGTAPASVSKMKIQNISESVVSEAIDVLTTGVGGTLTVSKLLGSDLNENKVRSIFRYQCEFNFLQKNGTTTQSFDCTNGGGVSCDGNPANNFCILKARFPYYLFSDTYSNNFFQKIADRVYGNGADKVCGQQIKQIDCVGKPGDPTDQYGTLVKSFGLYGELTGIWETSVQLGAGPDLTPVSYGFAARTSSTGECPPGLVKKVFFKTDRVNGIITTDITPSHNFTSGLIATEVSNPTVTPPALGIQKWGGGRCDLTAVAPAPQCTLPNSFAGIVKSAGYSSVDETVFCVIPDTMLE